MSEMHELRVRCWPADSTLPVFELAGVLEQASDDELIFLLRELPAWAGIRIQPRRLQDMLALEQRLSSWQARLLITDLYANQEQLLVWLEQERPHLHAHLREHGRGKLWDQARICALREAVSPNLAAVGSWTPLAS